MATDEQAQRDFFVSYTQTDRAWAEWLAWELEAAGYTTVLQAWDMPPGTAFVHAMDQAVQTCRRTVLVLSPAYLRSGMAEAEWRAGFVSDPSGEQRHLLPVQVEPCTPKGLLADRGWIDLTGADEATARALLREGVAAALRGHGRPATRPRFPRAPAPAAVDRPRFPTALPPVWNVPFLRNPTFTGRDEALAGLANRLQRGGAVAVTQVLQGGGGVGKTALAVEYAWRHRAGFEVVWWVRAQEPATLVGDYADLAAALNLDEATHADQQRAAAGVRRWLEGHDRWLLVLDNAQAPDAPSGLAAPLARVADLLPRVVHGQVLVTSRDATWDRHASLTNLGVFTPAEAAAFLLARAGSTDEHTAAKIAELLGFLPLALEQAGAYTHETQLALAAYLERLRRFPAVTLGKGQARDRDPADTVATTWQVSLARVRPTPGAVALLEACAFLAPEEIPRDLFTQPLDPPAEDLAALAADPFALDDAVAALRRFALVKATPELLTVHRLVQQVVRDHLNPGAAAARAGVAVRLLAAAFPVGGYADPGVWPACASLLPHALAATGHAEQDQAEPLAASDLLDGAASYLRGRGRYAEARTLRERSLSIRETCLGADHPDTATSLDNLAEVLHDQGGDLDHARALHERALAIREAHLGGEHPDTATSLSNLAHILADQGDLEHARGLDERALAIREARLGPEHPQTARSLNELGEVLHDQGALDHARAMHERALAIYEARSGADHPDIARSLSRLANVLRDQGDLPTARTLHERALAIYEANVGADHPDTAWSLNNLAAVLRDQGDLARARALYERALSIREARLGPDHRDTVRTRGNLAAVLAELEER
jgi:tetratricopeptide (TPR) repeat protein